MKYKFNNRYLFVQFAALIFRVSAELMSLVRLLHKTLPHTSTPVSTLALHITQPPPKFSIIFAFDLSRFFFFLQSDVFPHANLLYLFGFRTNIDLHTQWLFY